jgi:hypothetical protein
MTDPPRRRFPPPWTVEEADPNCGRAEKQTTGGLRMPTKTFIADAESRNAITVLVWLAFVGMASPVLAQGPLPIPSGPSPVLAPPGPPARLTVHPRPRLNRHCTRWYVVHCCGGQRYLRVPFPDECR